MPTARGFTGQYADASTGLDYYGARYYDPAVGQFAQADTDAKGGLNRYAYVGGNPETKTDPSGHRRDCQEDDSCGSGGGGGGGGGGASGFSGSSAADGGGGSGGDFGSWTDYAEYIAQHRHDGNTLPPEVFDDRGFDGDLWKVFGFHRTREDNQETADAYVLMAYFGLTVYIQDRSDGNNPNTPKRADYLVGLFQAFPALRWPGAQFGLGGATPMDLMFPEADTTRGTIDRRARAKAAGQAPIIVIDMSENNYLKGLSSQGLVDFGDYLTNTARGTTVPKRVIFILNGVVEYDTFGWGPGPDPASYD
ncbi:MAG: hypothetical protein OJF49_001665 [Ktedonobacterales bacterium]|jgi:RHS repeat-associated protein|nr:MAG: hypothetical protein OJF49_001665 [Ktedonobacterales bacterium]